MNAVSHRMTRSQTMMQKGVQTKYEVRVTQGFSMDFLSVFQFDCKGNIFFRDFQILPIFFATFSLQNIFFRLIVRPFQ